MQQHGQMMQGQLSASSGDQSAQMAMFQMQQQMMMQQMAQVRNSP